MIAQSAERHGEAALGVGVAPVVGADDDGRHVLWRDVAMASHPHGDAVTPDAGDRLAHRAHVASVEIELAGAQDRFVAELQDAQARLLVCRRPGFAGAHDGRRPAVLRREPLPRFDGVRPRFRITDGITTGEADADLDAVRDRGLAARREDDRLVAAGGEVSERVVGTEVLDQPADRGLVVSGEGVVGALRAEERHDGGEERDGTEETEDRVDEDARVAVEHLVVDRSRRGDAVQGPEESLVLR